MKRSPIRRRSAKRQRQMAEHRIPTIEAMIAEGRGCEVCPRFEAHGAVTRCAQVIQGLHERRKSGAGGSRENPANLVPACNWGNDFIEDNPGFVRLLTGTELVVREGDPEWDDLGVRAWRERA